MTSDALSRKEVGTNILSSNLSVNQQKILLGILEGRLELLCGSPKIMNYYEVIREIMGHFHWNLFTIVISTMN